MAAAIMVVRIVRVFLTIVVVVVCACLILQVLTALLIGMLAVGAMQMAWLVELTLLGGGAYCWGLQSNVIQKQKRNSV
jgi:hypothetical protein